MNTKKWFDLSTEEGSIPTVHIYSEIGGWGITANQFAEQVKAAGSKDIRLKINSYGGDVFEGIAIYNFLKDYNVHVEVDGIAASIASIIALAGKDLPEISEGGTMLIHEAWAGVMGRAKDMEQAAQDLEKINDAIAQIYAVKTGRRKNTIRRVMDEGALLSADESVELGLAKKSKKKSSNSVNNEELMKYGFTKGIEKYSDTAIKNLLTETDNENNNLMLKFTELKNWFESKFKALEQKPEQEQKVTLSTEENAKIQEALTTLSEVEAVQVENPENKSLAEVFKDSVEQIKTLNAKVKEQELEIAKMSAPGYRVPDPDEEKREQNKKTKAEQNSATKNAVAEAIKNRNK